MTAYEEAEKLYANSDTNLKDDIDLYCRNYFCIAAPHCIILARLEEECWFIHLLVGRGSLSYFLNLMPVYRPFVAWARRGNVAKIYKTETLQRLIL